MMTEDEVRQLLDPARVISTIESAFRDRYASFVMPARTHLNLAEGIFLIMPCYDRAGRALGMKLVVVHAHAGKVAPDCVGPGRACPERQSKEPGQAAHSARVQATYLLLDPETGQPKTILPANYLTDLRTAATSAVATKILAREDVKTLGIFGTGRQARAHAKVLPLVRNFERLLVCGQDSEQSRAFAQAMAAELTLPVASADHRTCAAESDVICTCTTSQTPLFDGNVLRPGTHLNLVGAFQPHAREVDSLTVERARVVVDTYDAALAEAGDLLVPMREGRITREHLVADLHDLLNGKKLGRTTTTQITLFKSVGCALEDLVTAELLTTAH